MGFVQNIKALFTDKEQEVLDQIVTNAIDLPNEEAEPDVTIIKSGTQGFGSLRHVINFDSNISNLKKLILSYREVALYPEVDAAIQEITNEAIVIDTGEVVALEVESDEISEKIKKSIKEEFELIISMMEFNTIGDETFRQWYEDGRIYLHGVLDIENIKEGIQDIKVLSPLNLKRIKKEEDKKYYYVYDDEKSNTALEIPSDHITFCSSGLTSADKSTYISYIHKAMKPFNQLKMLEDSAIIYRITRAPERRVFYVDVGQMNKSKAESYMMNLMNKFKNKIAYDSTTGKISQEKNTMTMTEDFWLPSSESSSGSRGTKIDTLPPGQNLGEMGDIEYFKKKLLRSLRVPYSRFDQENGVSSMSFGGMNGEMSRDEVRFSKFIGKLRSKFASVFFDFLKKQLIFKKIIEADEWPEIKDSLVLNWSTDSYFAEVKNSEIMNNRIELADALQEYVGKYFSNEYVMKNVFQMTDDEIKTENEKINKEIKAGEIEEEPPEDDIE